MPGVTTDTRSNASRISVAVTTPTVYGAMLDFSAAAARELDPTLAALVRVRVSQLNGCGFCLDLHSTEARSGGESERRLAAVAAWRLTPFFTLRERAALALAEAVTSMTHAIDQCYEDAAGVLDAVELGHLLWTIAAVNVWNRIAVSTRMTPSA